MYVYVYVYALEAKLHETKFPITKSPDEKMDETWISGSLGRQHVPPMQSCPQVYGDIHRFTYPEKKN